MRTYRQCKVPGSKYRWTACSFLCAGLVIGAMAADAATISSKELIENARLLSGKVIRYKGEVITAIQPRGRYAWVNVSDGDNAIGVWCKRSQTKAIGFVGNYKQRGDMVEIDGVFRRACPRHGGDLDIHAYTLRVVRPGHAVSDHLDRFKVHLAIALFSIVIVMTVIFRKRI